MEKVDVLLATYKSNLIYLKKQIDSILNQTHSNIHLYISDDNSQDEDLKALLEEYKAKDNRITIYYQDQNLGYTKNFGFLLEKSTAEYICFSDHDDIWYPTKIQKSLELLKSSNVDLVYCNCKQIDENDNIINNNYFKYKNIPLIKTKSHLAISRCIGIGCSQLFTKKIRDKMLPYKETVMAHDWLAAFIANQNNGMDYITEPLFDYRLHQSNVFGGRSLDQNLNKWKTENGNTFSSYLKYREEKVINKAYLTGAQMCLEYANEEAEKDYLNKLINYYQNLKKSKYINLHFISYFKYLYGKNLTKKMLKEFIIFHLPILGYIRFKK